MAPLLKPVECCVLFIDPRQQHIALFDASGGQNLRECLARLAHAAARAAVPAHLAFAGPLPEPEHRLLDAGQFEPAPTYALGNSGSSWANSGLASALAAHNRASLVLAGFWLETTVTFMALPALAAGFDVSIVIDATPARTADACSPAIDRLLHAGAVTTTTHQPALSLLVSTG
jgi:nicotinamidase-related amidase